MVLSDNKWLNANISCMLVLKKKKHLIQIVETESFESALSVKGTKALQPTGTLFLTFVNL